MTPSPPADPPGGAGRDAGVDGGGARPAATAPSGGDPGGGEPFADRHKQLSGPAASGAPVLSVRDLRVRFPTDDGVVHAVEGVSFDVFENEVVGMVGESGSGKTATALAVLGLLPPAAEVSGDVLLRGRSISGLPERELRALRGSELAMVFQDALAAFNPVHTVGRQVGEALAVHHPEMSARQIRGRTLELLDLVGIPDGAARIDQYPHEYSGGMRQRAMIAMAIADDPAVLIADEPTTALDVTIQAQVLEVLERVQARTSTAIVLITHELGVVAGVADRVVVMYAGRLVETGDVERVFYRSQHPYTLGLLASLPRLDADDRLRLRPVPGQPPSLVDVPPGCAFHPRCRFARLPDPCSRAVPDLRPVDDPAHAAACHFAGEVAAVPPGEGELRRAVPP